MMTVKATLHYDTLGGSHYEEALETNEFDYVDLAEFQTVICEKFGNQLANGDTFKIVIEEADKL